MFYVIFNVKSILHLWNIKGQIKGCPEFWMIQYNARTCFLAQLSPVTEVLIWSKDDALCDAETLNLNSGV